MTYYRKTDNAKAQIVEHSPVTDSVYVQFDNEPPQIMTWNEFIEMVTLKQEVSDGKQNVGGDDA